MPDVVAIRRALISVSDKTNLEAFARGLASQGVTIISTGGTAAALRRAGIPVTLIDEVTGFPEMMDGRIKTLHPRVHGGLLGVRDNPEHARAMAEHAIEPIDLVCVNLYPFEATVARAGCTREEAIENIDIGGPSMLRSAAKNHEYVTVVTCPSQYERVAEAVRRFGGTPRALRGELAREAFALTSRYDAAIAGYLGGSGRTRFPALLNLGYVKVEDLRYGENPHQGAALYRTIERGAFGIAEAEQLHGKELSYNNIYDAQAALSLAVDLLRVDRRGAGACVVKHTNPCGAAIAPDLRAAIDAAIQGDPLAAYGGILAVNQVMDEQSAERFRDKELFFEVIVAPSFTAEALEILRSRWANVRLLAVGEPPGETGMTTDLRTIPGGLLAQERDETYSTGPGLVLRAGPEPGEAARRCAAFLETVVRYLFSNAVVLGGVRPGGVVRVFGAGAGQMDRVTSCRLAVEKAGDLSLGAVCVSDAFFPFADGPTILADAGVRVIVHPGGSKRDEETFELCRARGISCLTSGLRHFRH